MIPGLKAKAAICVEESRSGSGDNSGADAVPPELTRGKKFDYIILGSTISQTDNISRLLENVYANSSNQTRIIIHEQNYLWAGILKIGTLLRLKRKEQRPNWLSVSDIRTYLKAMGFEVTQSFRKTIFPLQLVFIGPLLNWIFSVIPVLDFLMLDQFIIARAIIPTDPAGNTGDTSLSICITVRDEADNIASLCNTIPVLSDQQEILFIEGHSKDHTVKEIERMQALLPEKRIRMIHQDGVGQGDAIYKGFKHASGEIIILYEGDCTCDPGDLKYVYECMLRNNFEFIEGSRFSYPLMADSMPLINKIGNIFFAKWFSFFLRQRTTDVLSGIKAIRKCSYGSIYDTWGYMGLQDPFGDFELLYGAARYGLHIGEIPIRYKPRTYGKSKTIPFKHGPYLFKMAVKGFMSFRFSR